MIKIYVVGREKKICYSLEEASKEEKLLKYDWTTTEILELDPSKLQNYLVNKFDLNVVYQCRAGRQVKSVSVGIRTNFGTMSALIVGDGVLGDDTIDYEPNGSAYMKNVRMEQFDIAINGKFPDLYRRS